MSRQHRFFIEISLFTKMLEELGDPDLLRRIQAELIDNPEKGDIVPGTGGARKVRVAKAQSGKRGGYRVLYFDLPEHRSIYLLMIYDKRMKEDVSEEQKKFVFALTKGIRGELA